MRSSENKSATQAKREVLFIFGAAILLCSIFWQLRFVPFFRDNLHALIAAVFLYLPTGLILRRRESFEEYGLTIHPVGKGLKLFLIASAIIFPLFGLGFFLYYRLICSGFSAGMWLPRGLQAMCRRFLGRSLTSGRLANLGGFKELTQLVLAQILVVALPEEYFFRGYILSRLEVAWPSNRRLWGAPVGWPLLWSSVMFALGHLLVDFNGLRLAVFFPALVFGWLRQASGSIFAGVLFHAASNLVSEFLHRAYFLR